MIVSSLKKRHSTALEWTFSQYAVCFIFDFFQLTKAWKPSYSTESSHHNLLDLLSTVSVVLFCSIWLRGGPQLHCGNTLASHLWGRRFKSWTLCEKVGSCLPMLGSLQYRTLTNCMCWCPVSTKLPIVIWPAQCWKKCKTPNKYMA